MNPTEDIIVSVSHEASVFQSVEIDSTKWFSAAKKEPGQPGVFEVNALSQFDTEASPRRFSFFNGKSFGPISSTPEGAFRERFNFSSLTSGITEFRGLVKEVA